MNAKEALFYTAKGKNAQCRLCPHHCSISEGQTGICKVRRNIGGKAGGKADGKLVAETYGKAAAVGVDPIEKKPFFHFFPGEQTLSIATAGCNMHCKWCQNHNLSQHSVDEIPHQWMPPEGVVELCQKDGLGHISYTYNEPTVFYEYALDTMKIARDSGIKNSWVSNGFIEEKPFLEAAKHLDAINMDFKTGNPEDYKKYCGADAFEVVKRTARLAVEAGVHLEVTTLIVPGINDNLAQLEKIFKFLADLDKNIPLHLSRFHPDYKMIDREATPVETMEKAAEAAKNYLDYVYLGNIFEEGEDTLCPSCKSLLIKRVGYSTNTTGVKDGACSKCGGKIPIVG